MGPTLPYDSPVHRHLHAGEHVRWVARPRQGWAVPWVVPLLLPVQFWAAVLLLRWAAGLLGWLTGAAGLPGRPAVLVVGFVVAAVAATARQVVADRRRRAGTWYALTDRRLLFVRTDVTPESAIGVDFDNIATVSVNRGRNLAWFLPPDAILVELKEDDIYLSASKVMGYQTGGGIWVADVPDLPEVYDVLRRRGRPPATGATTPPQPTRS